MIRFAISFLVLIFSCVASLECISKPAHIEQSVWNEVSPYLMPDDHPIKAKLDKFFGTNRITLNTTTLAQAGFKNTKAGDFSHVVVSKHSKFKAYIFKLYTDDQREECDWQQWVKRAAGARDTQQAINKYGYQNFFVVPKKWIYVLPATPNPPAGYVRKNFILVAENMHIMSRNQNKSMWRTSITEKHLDAFFTILKEVGLWDSIWPFNSPFTRTGKIAFIDLERNHESNVPYDRLLTYLSPKMQAHWKVLIANNGPK